MPSFSTHAPERDLPESVKAQMSARAQDVFRAAFAQARREHRDDDTAFKLAWGAVQRDFAREERAPRA